MTDWNKEKIHQLADKSKKPLEKKIIELGIYSSPFVVSLMTKKELEDAIAIAEQNLLSSMLMDWAEENDQHDEVEDLKYCTCSFCQAFVPRAKALELHR